MGKRQNLSPECAAGIKHLIATLEARYAYLQSPIALWVTHDEEDDEILVQESHLFMCVR